MAFSGPSRKPCFIEEDDGLASLAAMEPNGFEDRQPHFLDACFLCKKTLRGNKDIFMYRGDTPFCSEESRQEQIDMDEATEKNRNLCSSMKSLRKKDQRKSEEKKDQRKSEDYPFRTGTVAVA
ncbi:hypothetical protein F3Y22_tig00110904pilonHSYRG00305 [Hibiscus syriacus]|uniref:FLZ-type domain-containing protein n=1 Tax=Hibiscus syriacus TaxID=106335 RepID=A0A6A2ZE06_HIBSY|nr:hypothetical protein F3Y22_tig00110904pilonHSYRG00305 [Hibiscus syriacus]